MKFSIVVIGVVILVLGAIIPATSLSVFASAPPTVDCSAWPSDCTVTVSVSNTGTSSFTAPFTAYFVYKNTLGQTVLIDKQAWTSQASLTDSGFTPTAVPGAGSTMLGFSVNVFFVDANGVPMGSSASTTFSVLLHFTIMYEGVGNIAVSPAGTNIQQCASACPGGLVGASTYSAYWPAGTSLTVTTSAGTAPVYWGSSSGTNCPPSGSGFVCTIPVSQDYTPIIESTNTSIYQYQAIMVEAQPGGFTPTVACIASGTETVQGYACSASASFSATVPSGYTWSGNLWTLDEGSTQVSSGNTTSFTLSYSALSPKVSFTNGLAVVTLLEAQLVPITPGGGGGDSGTTCSLSPSTNAGLYVLVVSSSGKPLSGALVTAGGASGITDNTGHALLCNFPVPNQNALSNGQGSVAVTVSDAGYSTTTQSANVIEGQTSQATVQLSSSFGFSPNILVIVIGAAVLVMGLVMPEGAKRRRR